MIVDDFDIYEDFSLALKLYTRKKNEMKSFVDFADKFDRVVYHLAISVAICLRIS